MDAGDVQKDKVLETVSGYINGVREGKALAGSLQRHTDRIVVWIIGLSAGAVVTLPAALSYVIDARMVARGALALVFSPFILAVLTGIAYRLILAKVMETDELLGFAKIHDLESLKFTKFEGTAGVQELIRKVLAIMEYEGEDLSKLKSKLGRWQRYATWLEYWPYVLFGLGVFATGGVVVFPPVAGGSRSMISGLARWILLAGLLLSLSGTLALVFAQRPAADGVHGTIVQLRNRWLLHVGLILLAVGFVLQAAAVWLP